MEKLNYGKMKNNFFHIDAIVHFILKQFEEIKRRAFLFYGDIKIKIRYILNLFCIKNIGI